MIQYIPQNAVICNQTTGKLRTIYEISNMEILPENNKIYTIITEGNHKIVLFGDSLILSNQLNEYKLVRDLTPQDYLFISYDHHNYNDGIMDDNIPKLLGMSLISRMNGTTLFSAVKDDKEQFMGLLNNINIYIDDIKEGSSVTDKLNAFYRYCNTGAHVIPDIINRFSIDEMLIFIKYLVNIYAKDNDNKLSILITHDNISAEYINIFLHRCGIESYINIINERYGQIYDICIVNKEQINLLNDNIEMFKNKYTVGPDITKRRIKSIIQNGDTLNAYKLQLSNIVNDCNDKLVLNDILIV